jgi:exopolyphosphatase/guanosine-5'-triphosphate,3'-diphosphate pyrophosphatase
MMAQAGEDRVMRVGVIDLGTNSVRFAIYECSSPRKPKRSIYKQKIMLRPGKGVFTSGRLQPVVMARILRAMKRFHREARRRKTDVLEAFATSALREAKNSKALIAAVYQECGLRIRVISGAQEAALIARGILHSEPDLTGHFALIDIGGGSTEINLCQGHKLLSSVSLRLGALRLQQLFMPLETSKNRMDRGRRISAMRRHIRRHLSRHERVLTRLHVHRGIGSSGSIRALSKVISKSVNPRYYLPLRLRLEHERPHFSRSALSHFTELLTPLTLREIRNIPGLEPRRADLILPAAILLEELMLFLGIDEMYTTEYSLRDGLVLAVLEQVRRNGRRGRAFSF